VTTGPRPPNTSPSATGPFDGPARRSIAMRLRDGERRATAIGSLLADHPQLAVPDAYAIQAEYVRSRVEEGGTLRGYKIGAAPDLIYGALFGDQVLEYGATIEAASLIRPAIEVEIAFQMRSGLEGPVIREDDVLAATESVAIAFEIVDSRIQGTDANLVEIVADNGRAARLVLGRRWVAPSAVDLAALEIALERNDVLIGRSLNAAVLGHPVAAVVWLANELARAGGGIAAGDLVLSGALTRAEPVRSGDRFRAGIPGLGEVVCRFG
jgi:2-keto-4-pentenoate hydratase